MSFYFEEPADYDEFVEQWKLKSHKGDVNFSDPNVFLRKYAPSQKGAQEYVTLMGVVKSLMREITDLKTELKDLKEHSDKRDDELAEHNKGQDERIDQSWDVQSERIADLEIIYQQKGYLSYENEPEEADEKPRRKVKK